MAQGNEDAIGELSHSERIAVALVLNRLELLEEHSTILDAIDRLGLDDLTVCLHLHRNRIRSKR